MGGLGADTSQLRQGCSADACPDPGNDACLLGGGAADVGSGAGEPSRRGECLAARSIGGDTFAQPDHLRAQALAGELALETEHLVALAAGA